MDVVIFEGWCVGFRAWDENTLYRKWVDAVNAKEGGPGRGYTGRLGFVLFEDVRVVNEALRGYDGITEYFLPFPVSFFLSFFLSSQMVDVVLMTLCSQLDALIHMYVTLPFDLVFEDTD